MKLGMDNAKLKRNLQFAQPECNKKSCILTSADRSAIFAALANAHPHPQSELVFHNPFELLCAVVLSAQATDSSVNKVTPALFAAAPDAASMAALGPEGIAPYIRTIGLWRAKAGYLSNLSAQLQERFQGQVPSTFEELISLPGVGSKTAKVVLNVAFGQPVVAVDTHIFRVCQRTGLCIGKDAHAVEEQLPFFIPEQYMKEAHHYLLLHGRYVCTARRPQCLNCIIAQWCKKRGIVKGPGNL